MLSKKHFVICLATLSSLFVSQSVFAVHLEIRTEKDPYAVFYPAKTYKWHPLSMVNGKFDDKIRGALDRELTARGFQKTTTGTPDFWVGYQFSKWDRTERIAKRTSREDYSWDEKKYRDGTLRIDVFSPDQRRIIWKGWSEAVYDPDLSDEEKIKMADEAIKRMVAELPPPG